MTTIDVLEDRALPNSLEAERSVLGAILLHDEVFAKAAAIIKATDFFRDAHRRIFEKMMVLVNNGIAIDLVTLKDELIRMCELDEVGGPAYIAALVDGMPRSSNIEHYAGIVREKARLRGLIDAGNKTITTAYDAEIPAAQVADQGMNALLAFIETPDAGIVSADAAVSSFTFGLDNLASDEAMKTGFFDLDEMLTGGLRTPEYTVVAGRPGVGKTSLGLGIAKGLAMAGFPSVFFSLEMRTRALAGRLLSWLARVDKSRIATRMLRQDDYPKMAHAVAALEGVPLYLQDSATSLTEIVAWCQRLRIEHGLRCAVIDYLQLLVPERRHASREVEVASISKGLKRLATTQDLAIVALSALNRSPENRKDNRPRLSDLRESGAIESDADVVMLLFRADQYENDEATRGIAEVIVAKNREGATGVTKLVFLAELGGLFESLALTGQA